jgi:hypothetical protein
MQRLQAEGFNAKPLTFKRSHIRRKQQWQTIDKRIKAAVNRVVRRLRAAAAINRAARVRAVSSADNKAARAADRAARRVASRVVNQ